MNCCTSGLADTFTNDVSRKESDRYRKNGLPPRARKLLAAIQSATNLTGKATLEIGVGAGAFTVEMLRLGAVHAIGVDAVPAQLANARALAAEFLVADRAEFELGDFTTVEVGNADVVVLDRVVCCYPEWEPLLKSAITHTRTVLALSYPRDTWWMKLIARAMNLWRVIIRSDFRFHIHPAAAMQALLKEHGFNPRVTGRYFAWEILVAHASVNGNPSLTGRGA